MENPTCVLLVSGKRKSGKDHITNILHEKLTPDKSVILRLSGPIKSHWAKQCNLNLDQLLGDGQYKEDYRLKMVKWGEGIRKTDYGYFCRAAVDMYNARDKSVWIVSDVRRKTDIQWFKENYGFKCTTIRITCSDEIRSQRGWAFTPGIDDSETECDLDDVNDWNLNLPNENDNIDEILHKICEFIE